MLIQDEPSEGYENENECLSERNEIYVDESVESDEQETSDNLSRAQESTYVPDLMGANFPTKEPSKDFQIVNATSVESVEPEVDEHQPIDIRIEFDQVVEDQVGEGLFNDHSEF